MSRRRTLAMGGIAALALPAVIGRATAAPTPDEALIAWCARWPQTEDEYAIAIRPYDSADDVVFPPEVEALVKSLDSEGSALLEKIQATPALTDEGRKAKARVALRLALDRSNDDPDAEGVAWGLLRDLLAGDFYLAALNRVEAARAAFSAEAQTSRGESPALALLHADLRQSEVNMAQAGRAVA